MRGIENPRHQRLGNACSALYLAFFKKSYLHAQNIYTSLGSGKDVAVAMSSASSTLLEMQPELFTYMVRHERLL